MSKNIGLIDFQNSKQRKNIDNINKVIKRLIEIYENHMVNVFLEKHSITEDTKIDLKIVETILDKLCEEKILEEKIEYICPICRSTEILTNKLFEEYAKESENENCFLCNECENEISKENTTGFIYYNILNIEELREKYK